MNGHYSVEGSDLQEKQPQKCNSHCVCPHYSIWRAHQTAKNKDSLQFWFFFKRCKLLKCTLCCFIFTADLLFMT